MPDDPLPNPEGHQFFSGPHSLPLDLVLPYGGIWMVPWIFGQDHVWTEKLGSKPLAQYQPVLSGPDSSSYFPPATKWPMISPSCVNRGPCFFLPMCVVILALPPFSWELFPIHGHLAIETEQPYPVALTLLDAPSHSVSVCMVALCFSSTADWVRYPHMRQ